MPKGYVNEKFTFLKPFYILSNLVIQICTLVTSSWVHQSCAVQNNYSDTVFGVQGIVLFKFCHLYYGGLPWKMKYVWIFMYYKTNNSLETK